MIIIALLYKNTIPFFSFSVFLFINIVFAIAQKNKQQTKKRQNVPIHLSIFYAIHTEQFSAVAQTEYNKAKNFLDNLPCFTKMKTVCVKKYPPHFEMGTFCCLLISAYFYSKFYIILQITSCFVSYFACNSCITNAL